MRNFIGQLVLQAIVMDIIQETALALQNEWGITVPEVLSEETILKMLTDRVVVLMDKGSESFFQLMYRLDISEKKLHGVLHEADVAAQIARLIYDRQLQKISSRQQYKMPKTNTEPDLEW